MKTHRPVGWPKLLRDWAGLRVRSLTELRNGYHSMPAGTEFTIHEASSGLRLQSEKCKRCGASMFISRVSPRDVELIR